VPEYPLDNNFKYHPPSRDQAERYAALREKAKELAAPALRANPAASKLGLAPDGGIPIAPPKGGGVAVTANAQASGGFGFSGLLAAIFITLKILGKITWSWWWVLSPLWIPLCLVLLVFLAGALVWVALKD